MKFEKILDLIIWFAIAVVGLVAAYVCFGILSSEASGQLKEYSVGGAIAGALVSWGVLTTVFLQLRGSSNELRDLRNENEILQRKLIRGAPRPQGFDTEVAERQRIVLARPKDWQPKGGIIFDFELGDEHMEMSDSFAANFRCYFAPIDDITLSINEYYSKELEFLNNSSRYVKSHSHEMIKLGAEQASAESLKIIAKQFVRSTIKKSRETGKIERGYNIITCEEFIGTLDNPLYNKIKVGKTCNICLTGYYFRKGAICYVNNIERETVVVDIDLVYVKLLKEDVAIKRTLNIALENPETGGIKTDSILISIDDENDEENSLIIDEDKYQKEAKRIEKINVEGDNENPEIENEKIFYQEITRMKVFCYNKQLETIYIFDCMDNQEDFKDSSAIFNQILSSVRFLN